MKTCDVIRYALDSSHSVLERYLGDLSDQDILIRPAETANHIAWQIGHLISSENHFLTWLRPELAPKLPAGFAEAHSRAASSSNTTTQFKTKQEYLTLYNEQRKTLKEALQTVSETDLSKPGPEEMRSYAPTIGAGFLMQAQHEMMHAGQFVVVRRILGKPIVI